MTLDPRDYALARIAAYKRPKLETESLRRRLAEVIGGVYDWERPSLDARVTESRQMDGYRRDLVKFTSRPGLTACGWLLVPDGIAAGEKRAGVVCLPGHGRGADSIVGIAEDGTQRKLGEWDEYASDYALQSVAQGFVTFALEQISFGRRRRPEAVKQGPAASSCHEDSAAALMLGECIIGWRVWDTMRALDYLETLPNVDAARLVTLGISGGGLTSLFTGALDTRVTACVVAGYLDTFAASVLSIRHCIDNYGPGLFALCEMPDIAQLVAPRFLYAESGDRDPIFPLAGFEEAARQIAAHYADAGIPERFAWDVFEGGHEWSGAGAWPFLKRQLSS